MASLAQLLNSRPASEAASAQDGDTSSRKSQSQARSDEQSEDAIGSTSSEDDAEGEVVEGLEASAVEEEGDDLEPARKRRKSGDGGEVSGTPEVIDMQNAQETQILGSNEDDSMMVDTTDTTFAMDVSTADVRPDLPGRDSTPAATGMETAGSPQSPPVGKEDPTSQSGAKRRKKSNFYVPSRELSNILDAATSTPRSSAAATQAANHATISSPMFSMTGVSPRNAATKAASKMKATVAAETKEVIPIKRKERETLIANNATPEQVAAWDIANPGIKPLLVKQKPANARSRKAPAKKAAPMTAAAVAVPGPPPPSKRSTANSMATKAVSPLPASLPPHAIPPPTIIAQTASSPPLPQPLPPQPFQEPAYEDITQRPGFIPYAVQPKGKGQPKGGSSSRKAAPSASKAADKRKAPAKPAVAVSSAAPVSSSTTTATSKSKSASAKAKNNAGTGSGRASPVPSITLTEAPPQALRTSYPATAEGAAALAADLAREAERSSEHTQYAQQKEVEEEVDDRLYCICQNPYDPERMMIACDSCDNWYHIDCINIDEVSIQLIDTFICPPCGKTTGKVTIYKNPCSREDCPAPALKLSKYCSDWCGITVAASRLQLHQKKQNVNFEILWEAVSNLEKLEAAVDIVEESEDRPDMTVTRIEPAEQPQGNSQLEALQTSLDQLAERRQAIEASLSLLNSRSTYLMTSISRAEELCAQFLAANPNPTFKAKRSKIAGGQPSTVLNDAPCGFDVRLVWDDKDFKAWLESGERRAVQQDSEEEETAGAEEEEGLICMNTKKRCDRHTGWQKTKEADYEMDKSVLTRRLEPLTEKERRLRRQVEDVQDEARRRAKRVRSIGDEAVSTEMKDDDSPLVEVFEVPPTPGLALLAGSA